MTGERILIVDDEKQINRLLSLTLRNRGYQTETASNAEAAQIWLAESRFDLVLLDLGLPDIDGLDLCGEIRSWSQVPIIVVSVRAQDREKVGALDLGADDYVTKPFSLDELLARIRASLRRTSVTSQERLIQLGDMTLDLPRRVVTRAGQPVHLTPTEYKLLTVLAGNAGRVVTHRQLLREVRGPSYEEEPRSSACI